MNYQPHFSRLVLTVLLTLMLACPLQAAILDTTRTATDTVPEKKRFWRASGEFMLAQVIPWSFNYFVRDADFAHISFQSIGHNLKPSSWEWDDNAFKTNQIGHPYQGSLYFSAFRTNGYNFWQSAPAAFAGSLMWEIAGETHNPAPNDFVNTSLGGIVLGEMSYRIANRIINKKQRGFKRQMSEVFGLLINPMNGLNRLIDGQWGRVSGLPQTDLDTTSITGELDFGARRISQENNNILTKGRTGWFARLRLQYGDPYKASKTPFSNFNIRVELGDDDSSKLNNVSVNGLLSSWSIRNGQHIKHLLSLTANYDYYHNSSFEYGGQSINISLYSEFNTGSQVKFLTRIGGGAVILAAVPNEYLLYGEGRNYDYGSGVSIRGQGGISVKQTFTGMINYAGGWFKTLNGSNSNYFLHTISAELRYRVWRGFSLGAEAGYFTLNGYYRDFEDTRKRYPSARLSIGYKI